MTMSSCCVYSCERGFACGIDRNRKSAAKIGYTTKGNNRDPKTHSQEWLCHNENLFIASGGCATQTYLAAAASNFALESFVEAMAAIFWEGSWFGIAENIDCFFRRVYDYPAILTLR